MMKTFGFMFLALSMSLGFIYAQSGKTTIVMGYIADVKCATSPNGISADGANLAVNPEKHTTACLKMPSCEASGYGILIKGSNGKYVFTKFDQKGNDLVKAYLKKTKRKDGHIVDATVTSSGGLFKVTNIKEAAEGMNMMDMKM